MLQNAQHAVGGDAADLDGVESPFAEDAKDFGFAAALGDEQHAFLRFAEHDFVRGHARFALRHAIQFDFNSHAATRSHLAGGAGESGSAHVLNSDDRSGGHGFETGLEQELLEKRIAHLDVGPLPLRLLCELRGGQQRGAVNAVAPGLGADVDDRIAFAASAGEEQLIFRSDSQGQNIDQRIPGIARLELHFAADRGNAETIAVKGDAANHAIHQSAIARDGLRRFAIHSW